MCRIYTTLSEKGYMFVADIFESTKKTAQINKSLREKPNLLFCGCEQGMPKKNTAVNFS